MTPNQERFAQEYLIDLNATQAAVRAGYSKKTAGAIGRENLQKPSIAAAISESRSRISREFNITITDIMTGLLREANFKGAGCSHSARVNGLTQLGRHLGMFDRITKSTEGELSSALTINIISPGYKQEEASGE